MIHSSGLFWKTPPLVLDSQKDMKIIYTWNLKHPFIHGCFSCMMNQTFTWKGACFWPFPSIPFFTCLAPLFFFGTKKIKLSPCGVKPPMSSGQIIATSRDLTPKGSWGREIRLFQGNLGWWSVRRLGKYYNLARCLGSNPEVEHEREQAHEQIRACKAVGDRNGPGSVISAGWWRWTSGDPCGFFIFTPKKGKIPDGLLKAPTTSSFLFFYFV